MRNISTDMPRHYRYTYKRVLLHGSWKHDYALVGRHGGVNLHISGPHVFDGRENWSAGLEFHYRQPPDYMSNQPPSHDECWLLKCPCWHDGTSLYAQEHYLPMFMQGCDEIIFRDMARDADEKFGMKCESVS